MKKSRIMNFLLLLLLITIFLVVIDGVSHSQPAQNVPPSNLGPTSIFSPTQTRSPNCVPYPTEDLSTRTPTPDLGRITIAPNTVTYTPYPTPNIQDLSPDDKDFEKMEIVVFRCDGTRVYFIVGPDIKIPQDLPLGVGDTIVDSINIGPHPMPPPPPTWIPTPTANSTFIGVTPSFIIPSGPYPAPGTSEPIIHSPIGYPYSSP